MNNIIIGKRSILSKSLKKNLPKAKIITTEEFLNLKLDIKSNLIINTFYPSYRLNSISKYSDFIDLGLKNLCIGLDRINKKKINKIIYTSSASIYGLKKEIENSIINNRNIYSTSKLLAENIIKNYCYKNKINFTIARVFNLYGDNDNFSIISKLINAYNKNLTFFLNNNGSAVRDFISYNEVAKIYKQILKTKKSEVVDVGTGEGVQIKDLLKICIKKLNIKNKNFEEVKFSVCNKNKYNFNLKINNLINYLRRKLKIKNNIFIKK